MKEMMQAIQASDVTYRLGWMLLHSLWMGIGMAAATAMVLAMLRRRGAAVRYGVACGAMAVLMAGMGATYAMIPARAPVAAIETKTEMPEVRSAEPAVVVQGARPTLTAEPLTFAARARVVEMPEPARVKAERMLTPMIPWVVLAWAAGVLLLSVWQMSAWVAARRLCVVATQGVEQSIVERVERLKGRLGMSRRVRVLRSMLAQVPMTVGCLRPVILLPATLATGLSGAQLEMLLVHELAHIRRWDYLVNLVQTFVETVMFYHPAVWYISRRIRAEREDCCDDVVLAVCGDREEYAEALVACSGAAGRMALAASAGKLLPRVRRILGVSGERRVGRTALGAVAALFVLVGVVVVPLACKATRDTGDAVLKTHSGTQSAATRPAMQASLRAADLSGKWAGERDGVKVAVEFTGAEDAHWVVQTERAIIGADLKRVDELVTGTVGLRYDYFSTITGKYEKGSVILGKLERDASGQLLLSILPAAVKLEGEYRPVSAIPLVQQMVAEDGAIKLIEKTGAKVKWEGFAGDAAISVDFTGTKIGDGDLDVLRGVGNVKEVNLHGTRVTDAGLVKLAGQTRLETLSLDYAQVTGEGLAALKGLKQLTDVSLQHSKVTDKGLAGVKELAGLTALSLDHTQVTDTGLAALKEMKGLESLTLGDTNVTDAGLVELEGLSKLRQLVLFRTKITDGGLVSLKKLTRLGSLDLSDTGVTEKGAKELQAALPRTLIRIASRTRGAGTRPAREVASYEVVEGKLLYHHGALTTEIPGVTLLGPKGSLTVKANASNADKSVDPSWEAWSKGEISGAKAKIEKSGTKVRMTLGEHVIEADRIEILQVTSPTTAPATRGAQPMPASRPAMRKESSVDAATAASQVDRLMALPVGHMNDPQKTPEALRKEEVDRQELVREIGAGGDAAIAELVGRLGAMPDAAQDPNGLLNSLRWQLIRDIGSVGDKAIPILQKAGAGVGDLQRSEMVAAMAVVHTSAGTRALIPYLEDKAELVRMEAVSGLAARIGEAAEQGGNPEILRVLVKHVPKESTVLTRSLICGAMRRVLKAVAPAEKPDEKAVADAVVMLRERLKNDSAADIRETAACILTEFGDFSGEAEIKRAVIATGQRLDNGSEVYGLGELVRAVQRISGRDFGPVPMSPLLVSNTRRIPAIKAAQKELVQRLVQWAEEKSDAAAASRPATR